MPVVAGAELAALVPIDAIDDVRERIVVDPTAAFPPAPGERVGTLDRSIPGITVGAVPLVVSTVPPAAADRRVRGGRARRSRLGDRSPDAVRALCRLTPRAPGPPAPW